MNPRILSAIVRGLVIVLWVFPKVRLVLGQDETVTAVAPFEDEASLETTLLPATEMRVDAQTGTDGVVVTETITYTIIPAPEPSTSPPDEIPSTTIEEITSTSASDEIPSTTIADTTLTSPSDEIPSTTIDETTSTPFSPAPLPSPLPPMYPTAPPVSTITIGWRGSVLKTHAFNPTLPTPTHSCPRDAIAAMAHWRDFCAIGSSERFCWTTAPSIRKCCGKWVKANDLKYASHGRVMIPRVETYTDDYDDATRTRIAYVTQAAWGSGAREKVEVIMPGWGDYHMDDDQCQKWRTKNEGEFAFYMQNLEDFNLRDVDERGRLNDGGIYNGEYGDQTTDLDYPPKVRDGVY